MLFNRRIYTFSQSFIHHHYRKDTAEYRNVPKNKRPSELKSIVQINSKNKQFSGSFPTYPIQYQWKHQSIDYGVYFWQPKKKPKAVLINFHALNAHTGLSGHLAETLEKENIVVGGYDYKNFGQSGGLHRGRIDSVEELIATSEQFVNHTMQRYPLTPIYLSGLSLGGLIAFYVSLKKKKYIKGSIFLNPSFADNPFNNRFGKNVMKKWGKFIPPLQLIRPYRNNSSNYSLSEYKNRDKLMYSGRVWSSTIYNMLMEMGSSTSRFQEFDLPYLYIQGGTDKLVNPFMAFEFEEKAKSKQKQIVMIHDLWHALWFDDKQFEVIKMAKEWINQMES